MTNKPTWEEEFDRLTEMPDRDASNIEYGLYDEHWYPESPYELSLEKLKQFISTKLEEQRQEIIEIIIKNYIPGHSILTPTLDRIINLIKQ